MQTQQVAPLHPSFVTVYEQDILLSLIAEHLPWPALNKLAYWPAPAPSVMRIEVRRRIFEALMPFIPWRHAPEFFEALRETDGLITGSVVRRVLRSGQDGVMVDPFDLNIVIRNPSHYRLHALLTQMGYQSYHASPPPRFSATMKSVEVYEMSTGKRTLRITVALARRGPLHVVLETRSTADMNAITYDTVLLFYPRTTFAGEGIVLCQGKYEPGPMERDSGTDVELFSNNKNWTRSCWFYCPMMRRKTFEDASVARYRWQPLPDAARAPTLPPTWGQRTPLPFEVPSTDLTYQELYEWTISRKCWNEKCPGHALYLFRCSYLMV